MKARLSTDGGARGNPGPAAYGYVLEAEDGTVLAAHGERIGVATNNVAEYRALIAGLEKALDLHVDELEVVSDSELLVKQMTGEYRVRNEALRELSLEATRLARRLRTVSYRSVRREHNELARDVVGRLDLVEAERDGRRLVARDVEEPRFDVVRAAALVTLVEDEVPVLARRRPVLERGGEDGEALVDLHLDARVGALGRGRARLDAHGCHVLPVPCVHRRQT